MQSKNGTRRDLLAAMALALSFVATANAGDEAVLAAEYRKLRLVRGFSSGGAWNDDVDRFGGRKHVVMKELGEMLGDGKHTRAQIVALMGAPDEVLVRGHGMFREAYDGADPRVSELLVYYWRGGHDFLYFASDQRRVLASGWWAALE